MAKNIPWLRVGKFIVKWAPKVAAAVKFVYEQTTEPKKQ